MEEKTRVLDLRMGRSAHLYTLPMEVLMKKILFFTITIVFLLYSTGCTASVQEDPPVTPQPTPEPMIVVTLPNSVLESKQIEEIAAIASDIGNIEIKNESEVISYNMPQSAHEELIKRLRLQILDSYHNLIINTASGSIYEINNDFNFTVATMVVDQEVFTAYDDKSTDVVANGAIIYQLMSGNNEPVFTLRLQDKATYKVFDTKTYP